MDHVTFFHRDALLSPGTWWVTASGELLFKCPLCKSSSEMLNHRVDERGVVTASMACFAPCQHHVWGKLLNWTYGVKEVGQKVKL